ncbi:hypothetical protein [Micavibrio aeruginosavorus]|uniref:Uncharacterized protein n=1 Tax=Micavibrio aeruginosavorus (strain ARL-13) TaxID=856793 RepID=G2KMZ9_MICAA|nr:hypothetical protein [Micavibrio aeruginosavorus]AEP08931.1 hypothetical protein MICA_594 [Micavibrio aeruginosavorus ARL-13]
MTTDPIQAAIDALEKCRNYQIGDEIDRIVCPVIEQLRAHQSAQGWQPIETAPKDGTPFYARFKTPFRWWPYKKDAQRQGYPEGRWQEMNEYGGWKNTDIVPEEWMPHEKHASTIKAAGGE